MPLPARSLGAGIGLVVAGVLPGFLTASLAPRIRADFALDDRLLGAAVATFYVASAVASPLAGHLVERMGASRAMRLSAALSAASALGVALLADSAAVLVALLALGGAANAGAIPGGSALITRDFVERRRGLAFGVQQAGAPYGAVLAGLALPAVALPFGWRWAFVVAALLAVAASFGVPPGVRADRSAASARSSRGARRSRSSVHLLAVATALGTAASVGLVSFLVVFSVRSGIGETGAGLLLAATSLAAGTSRVAFGFLADRIERGPLATTTGLLVAAVAGYVLLASGHAALIVVGALLAGGLGWGWGGLMSLAVVQRRPEAPAAATATMMTGLFAGAIAGPAAVGLLADRGAFAAAWAMCAAFVLLAAAAVVAAGRQERRSARSGSCARGAQA